MMKGGKKKPIIFDETDDEDIKYDNHNLKENLI
jgi:hypothetical protein